VAESLRGRARVSEEVEALFIGKEGTVNSEGIGRIEFGEIFSASVVIPGESGKKTVVTADIGVGTTCQREKGKGNVPVQEFC
jgi:hypothetical protein